MKLIETIKNIWKIEDLRNRLLTTVLLVMIYRFGSYVVLPGIDPTALSALKSQTQGGLLALLDMFSGGAFARSFLSGKLKCTTGTVRISYYKRILIHGFFNHDFVWRKYVCYVAW